MEYVSVLVARGADGARERIVNAKRHTLVGHRSGTDTYVDLIEALLQPAAYALGLLGTALYFDGPLQPLHWQAALLSFLLAFPARSRLTLSYGQAGLSLIGAWLWHATQMLLIGLATGTLEEIDSDALRAWLCIPLMLSILAQLLLRRTMPVLLQLAGDPERAIIVGVNPQGLTLAERLGANPRLHTRLLGFFDNREPERLAREVGEVPDLLGRFDEVAAYANRNGVNAIYLSLPMSTQNRVLSLLEALKDTTTSIYFVPDSFVTDLIQGRMSSVDGIPVVAVCETPFSGINGLLKRGSDIVLSLLILLMISPLLLGVGLAVKLTSPGPAIFKQRRYGLDGKEILVYKFRSMTVTENGGTITQARKNDQRFTPIGGFLRKSSLDELPQFINVLQGRMSIVGPRPHAVAHNELYRKLIKGYMVRHKVKPGITGWAQVNGYRGETETVDKMEKRIDYDLDYLRNWSLAFDLRIILRTFLIVAKTSNAY